MSRTLRWLLLVFLLGLVAVGGVGVWLLRSPNALYEVYETVYRERFHQYDGVIEEAARRRGVDPALVKAVVWRESRFRPDKVGLDGERGLMQITDAAAREYAKSEKLADFVPTDLFDPRTNIETGTWLLARALHRYEDRDVPLVFALAEYNAGRSRVAKWIGERNGETPSPAVTSQELQARIDIASTRAYIETVQERVNFYHQRNRL